MWVVGPCLNPHSQLRAFTFIFSLSPCHTRRLQPEGFDKFVILSVYSSCTIFFFKCYNKHDMLCILMLEEMNILFSYSLVHFSFCCLLSVTYKVPRIL